MGLDQYLHKNKYLGRYEYQKDSGEEAAIEYDQATGVIKAAGLDDALTADNTFVTVQATVAQWRKANQVHAWFVHNVQSDSDNCGTYDVSIEQLTELKRICDEVLKLRDRAPGLLPVEAGFFFGSTEYDEWYFKDLEYTSKRLSELLESAETDSYKESFTYSSSW